MPPRIASFESRNNSDISLHTLPETPQSSSAPAALPAGVANTPSASPPRTDTHSRHRFAANLERISGDAGRRQSSGSLSIRAADSQTGQATGANTGAGGVLANQNGSQLRLRARSRAQLNKVRAELEALRRSNQQSNKTVRAFHDLLREALGNEHTYAASRLSMDDVQTIRNLEKCMQDFPEVERYAKEMLKKVDELDAKFGKRAPMEKLQQKAKEWADWVRDSVSFQDVLSILLSGAGIGAGKNISWYIPKKIPSVNVPFDSVKAMAKLIASRWAVANLGAATIEYGPAIVSQRIWKAAGNSMNTWLGVAQAWDMVGALLALKATGEETHAHEGAGFACSALAVMIQTGMLNSVVSAVYNKFAGGAKGDELAAMQEFPQERVAASGAALNAEQDGDAENIVSLPQGSRARNNAAKIGHLLDAFPESSLDAKKQQIQKHSDRIESVHTSIQELAMHVAETEAATESELPEANAENLHAVLIENMLASLESCKANLGAVIGTSDADHVAEQRQGLDEMLMNLKEVKEDLEKSGGKNPKTIGFFGVMSAVYVGLIAAGNIGPALGVETLKNLNVRGALTAVGSVPMQTLANSGHFLFKDNPNLPALLQHVMGTLKAIAFTPGEFIPLETGITYSEKGAQLAGKVPEAPIGNWPSASTVRLLQELVRSVANPAFNTLGLGQALKPQHIAGVAMNMIGSGVAIGLGLKAARTEQAHLKTE